MTFASDHAVLTQDSVLVQNVPDSYVLRGIVTPIATPQLEVRYYQRYLTASGIIPLWPTTHRFPGFLHHGEVVRIHPDYLTTADQEKLRQLKQQAGWGWYQYIGALFIVGCLLFGALSAHFESQTRSENLRALATGDVIALEDSVYRPGIKRLFFYQVEDITPDSVLLYKANHEIILRGEFEEEDYKETLRDSSLYDPYSEDNLWLSRQQLNDLEYRIRHVYQRKDN